MIGQRVEIWKKEEYSYADAYDFIPLLVSYIHEDKKIRPAMLVVPGGAYRYASPSEGDVVARWFYKAGYNVFVLAYTVNYLDEPLDRGASQRYFQSSADHKKTCRGMQYRSGSDRCMRLLSGRASLCQPLCAL